MSVSKIMFSTLLAMTVASPLFAKGDGPQCSCPQMPTPTCKPETPPPDENPQGTPTFPPTTSDTSGPHPQMPQPTHQTQASPPSSFGTLNVGISYLPVKELVRTAKPIPYGLSFLDEMRGHVEEGIALATLMVEKTQDDDLRSFGQGMQKNLSQELSKISSWRSHWYPSASEFKNFSLGTVSYTHLT